MLFDDGKEKTDSLQDKNRQSPGKVIPGEFYDKSYFSGDGGKSNWAANYDEITFGPYFKNIAAFLTEGFPMARTVLDVGCAKGLLVNGFHVVSKINEIPIAARGFDVSKYAIENAQKDAKPYIQHASVDNFVFSQDYDFMVLLDVLEHLTEKQTEDFLTRSRPFINDSLFAQIPLPHSPGAYEESSHINIHPREWWHEMFISCGWRQPWAAQQLEKYAKREIVVMAAKWEPFIYQSGNWEYE